MDVINSLSYNGRVLRNIPTINHSQDLFDDLGGDVAAAGVAIAVEMATRPAHYEPGSPVIHRPFDEVEWISAVAYPFENINSSRLSTGLEYGVWYGSLSIETTIRETLHYQTAKLIDDFATAGFMPSTVDRRVYELDLSRLLVDMTKPAKEALKFSNPADHSYAQMRAAQLRSAGAAGLLYKSARCSGNNIGLFSADGLSNARVLCCLTYIFDAAGTRVLRGSSDITDAVMAA